MPEKTMTPCIMSSFSVFQRTDRGPTKISCLAVPTVCHPGNHRSHLFIAARLSAGVALLCGLVILAVAGDLSAQESTPAFAIPSSDLVFNGTLTVADAGTIDFSAREGSLILVDTTPDDPYGRFGIVITLDRSRPPQDGKRAILAHSWRIEPDPAGGESMTRLAVKPGLYGAPIELTSDAAAVKLSVTSDQLQSFQDGLLITYLWEAVKRDPNALDGLYRDLYSLYGPIASTCRICSGVLVCGTTVACGGGGGGGGQAV